MSARIIRLRRPAILSFHDGPFVPERAVGETMAEVDRRWRLLCECNPACFDGRLCHVIGVHRNGYGGAVVHVADCAYRFHAVQDEGFDLGVRPLGVKGITVHNDRILLGRRSSNVGAYQGMWEFAPGGVVEPGTDPAEVVQRELAEETGLAAAGETRALAIVYDPVLRTWEMVYQMTVDSPRAEEASAEYVETAWIRAGNWPSPLSPVSQQMTSIVESFMRTSA